MGGWPKKSTAFLLVLLLSGLLVASALAIPVVVVYLPYEQVPSDFVVTGTGEGPPTAVPDPPSAQEGGAQPTYGGLVHSIPIVPL